ncbi:MAG: phospholipase D-like domain-containing protein [Candidatus Nanopelagicales bacterium]
MASARRLVLAGLLVVNLGLAACASDPSSSTPSSSVEVPTASYSPPPDAQVTPPELITLANVQPNEGIQPVIDFIESARSSVDISIYRIDSDFTPLIDALQRTVTRGIPVRISISRQLVGQPNPPQGNSQQIVVQQQLQAKGLQVELSRPEFHYGHEKSIIIDAGTPNARAMVADWNLQASYFGPNQYGPVGARGMAVLNSDPQDVATIAAYFNANWPPYAPYPVSIRSSLVWSPSGIDYMPVGNSVAVLTDFIRGARQHLDIYAEYIQDNSFLIEEVIGRAQEGVTVRIVANSSGQSPQMIATLRGAGIQIRFDPIFEGNTSDPMFVHSKTMFADVGTEDQAAFIGSQNTFINESPEAILELGVLVRNQETIERAFSYFEEDWSTASETQASPSPAGN